MRSISVPRRQSQTGVASVGVREFMASQHGELQFDNDGRNEGSGNKIPRRIPSHLPVIPLSAVNTKTMTDRISRRRHDSKKH